MTKKGYKSVPWLFGKEIEIPEEWEVKRLGQLAKFASGEFLPESKQVNGKIPVYGGNGITGWHNQSLINNSTIVFGRVGAYCGIVYLTENKSWITDNAIFVKELSNDLDLKYLFLYLSRLNINLLAEVSAQPKISQGILNHIGIKFPIDKKEQQKIATILSNIDSLIESTRQVIENSKSLKTGLVQKLLTRGIGHTKFKKVPWFYGKEIEIPEEWNVKLINELGNVVRGASPRPAGDSKFFGGIIPWITVAELTKDNQMYLKSTSSTLTNEGKQQSRFLESGTFVIANSGATLGVPKILRISGCANDGIAVILELKGIISEFLYYRIFSWIDLLRNVNQGIGQPNLNTTIIGKLKIPLPPLPEQQKIATILSNIDSKITSQEQYKEKLLLLKKSLMQKLLTGEVRV